MKSALVLAWLVAIAVWVAGCGGAGSRSRTVQAAPIAPPPVAPCSLLTARQASEALDVHVDVTRSQFSCTFQGTRGHVFRAVVVTPQRLTAATRPTQDETGNGRIVQIGGPGYRGQAQNDPAAEQGASGLAQSNAYIVAGEVVVRLLVTYHTTGLRGVPQLREVVTLAGDVGRRLERAK